VQNVVSRVLGVGWIGYVIASYAITDVIISIVIRAYLNSHLARASAFVFVGGFLLAKSHTNTQINDFLTSFVKIGIVKNYDRVRLPVVRSILIYTVSGKKRGQRILGITLTNLDAVS